MSAAEQVLGTSSWWVPRDAQRARSVASSLLLVGALLVGALIVQLGSAEVPAVAWVVAAVLAVHAVVCWAAPASSGVGQLLTPLAAFTGTAGLAVMWWTMIGELNAGAALVGVPVVYAASLFRRPVVVLVVIATVSTAAFVLLANPDRSPLAAFDLAMVGCSNVILAVFVLHFAEAQESSQRQLQVVARLDPLTGLVTRRVFDVALADAVRLHPDGAGTALVIVDVDRFKTVNDVHGHPVGDAALQHIAAVLRSATREDDSMVGRLGGDELAVLLQACPPDAALRRGEAIVELVRRTPLVLDDGAELALTVSLGVAHAPTHGLDMRALYAAADRALYEAKRHGRDRAAVAL